jgi:hypothetical protein
VEWNFVNSYLIKRSHNGLGIEENIMTNCNECPNLFEHEPSRSKMIPFAKQYFKSKYTNWNEDMLIYKKTRDLRCRNACVVKNIIVILKVSLYVLNALVF